MDRTPALQLEAVGPALCGKGDGVAVSDVHMTEGLHLSSS
jgi:hypothetical protein